MVNWVEYAIARYTAQLRRVAAERPLTRAEEERLAVCESVVNRLELREAEPAERDKPYPRRSTRWSATY